MKKIRRSLLIMLLLVTYTCPAMAEDLSDTTYQWEIKAPAGSEMDLKQEKILYFGTEKAPVVVTSSAYSLRFTAQRVEYLKGKETFFAKGEVVIEGETDEPVPRYFLATGDEMTYSGQRTELIFPKGGTVQNRDGDILTAKKIVIVLGDGVQGKEVDCFEASGGFKLSRGEGFFTGDILKGDSNQGLVEAIGNIRFQYEEISGKAEKVIYFETTSEVHFLGEPLIYRGEDHIEGEKIIYNLDTKKAIVLGPVKARLYR